MMILILFSGSNIVSSTSNVSETITANVKSSAILPTVKINITPNSIIYEGDIIDCDITGNPTVKYWLINNQSKHTTFYEGDPIIFDPEPTPLEDTYVNLTVYAENNVANASDTVKVMIKRIYFGDIHWHTTISDAIYKIDTMYQNALHDNYLDFTSCTDHSELIDAWFFSKNPFRPKFDLIRTILHKIIGYSEWQNIKNKAIKYYYPGRFTTLVGFEWSPSSKTRGGWKISPNGWEDVGHINFYYREVYPEAPRYRHIQNLEFNMIFEAMANEYDKGHLNICFPHHPQAGAGWSIFATNFTFLANKLSKPENRDKILRGVEVNSRWGTSIGNHYTPDLPWNWPQREDWLYNKTDSWVENAMWEWSQEGFEGKKFAMMASSDTHRINRPGSATVVEKGRPATSGIIAAYAVHNIREEIWDAMETCDMYGTHLLKIRANVRFDEQMALGRWINCTSPLNITITAQSTFPGNDSSGKNMKPHGYLDDQLNYPIQDIWLIKKDRDKGRPWCKVINHTTPNNNTAVVNFQDYDVQPNDFYWVAIRQKGQELKPDENEYMAFIGPVFINNVDINNIE